jgi:hypothetical protein
MSDYVTCFGKLRLVEPKENETLDQLCKRLWIEKSGNKEEDYKDENNLFEDYYGEYIEIKGKIYEIFEHGIILEDDMFCHLQDNKDGTFSFQTRFYNGATCMTEMITEAFG